MFVAKRKSNHRLLSVAVSCFHIFFIIFFPSKGKKEKKGGVAFSSASLFFSVFFFYIQSSIFLFFLFFLFFIIVFSPFFPSSFLFFISVFTAALSLVWVVHLLTEALNIYRRAPPVMLCCYATHRPCEEYKESYIHISRWRRRRARILIIRGPCLSWQKCVRMSNGILRRRLQAMTSSCTHWVGICACVCLVAIAFHAISPFQSIDHPHNRRRKLPFFSSLAFLNINRNQCALCTHSQCMHTHTHTHTQTRSV